MYAPKFFTKCESHFIFFYLLTIIKENFESYYECFLKGGNVFYRASSITNFFNAYSHAPYNGAGIPKWPNKLLWFT